MLKRTISGNSNCPAEKELTAVLNLYNFNFKVWDKAAKMFQDKNKRKELIKRGQAIIDYQKSLIGDMADKGQEVFLKGVMLLPLIPQFYHLK